jgi:hypothetical protein
MWKSKGLPTLMFPASEGTDDATRDCFEREIGSNVDVRVNIGDERV